MCRDTHKGGVRAVERAEASPGDLSHLHGNRVSL